MFRATRLGLVCAAALAAVAAAAPRGQQMMEPTNNTRPYTQEAFDAAAAQGKMILVDFYAPWCPVCRAQEPKVTSRLNADYKHVVAFRVDYDSNVALRKAMNVQKQSTLILFEGRRELARLSYTSEDKAIDALFAHAKRS